MRRKRKIKRVGRWKTEEGGDVASVQERKGIFKGIIIPKNHKNIMRKN